MRILIFGASGMVGRGVLRECLHDPDVTEVLCVARSPLDMPEHAKFKVFNVADLAGLALQSRSPRVLK